MEPPPPGVMIRPHGPENGGNPAEALGKFAVIAEGFRAGTGKSYVGSHAEQAILQSGAKTAVHGQRDHQRGHA